MIKVRCNSKSCKGKVIGTINDNGSPADGGEKGLFSVRMRNDGYFGFECKCGNDSRVAEQENGIVKYNGAAPTRREMKEIWKRVKANPSKYTEKKGKTEIDGFTIEVV